MSDRVSRKNRIKDFADWADFSVLGTAVLLLIPLIASLVYLRLGLVRVFYPYALDLVEEAMLMQAWRVAQGLPVFVPPNAEFVPQVYMPLFTWLGGLLLRLTGFAFWPLRLISFLSTVGTAVLISIIGWRECGNKGVALAGGALFLAGYRLVGGWYDLARVDALFTFLSLVGMMVLVYGRSPIQKAILGGSLLGLAFLTKQNALLLAVAAGFYLFFTAESAEGAEVKQKFVLSRVPMHFAITFLFVVGLPIAVLQAGSDGWFRFYVVTIAYASPLELARFLHILRWDLVAGMGLLLGLWLGTAVWQLSEIWRRLEIKDSLNPKRIHRFRRLHRLKIIICENLRINKKNWIYVVNLQSLISQNPWLLFGGTAVIISVAGRATVGGNLNNMIVGYAFLCLAPALGLKAWSLQILQIDKKKSAKSVQFVNKKSYEWLFIAAVLLQFGLALFPLNPNLPPTYLPTVGMRAAGDTLLAQVTATEGEIWILMHPSYAVMAGKRPTVHLQSLWHARQRGTDPLPKDVVALIENQQFAQIISDESDFFEKEPAFLQLLLTHYEVATVLGDEQSPATLSGPIIRPLTVYVPRR
ncbi:hypothetical protein MNBD_CHLOROFLEXI01-811 [hydrothermal vent metagenome]|uniref:Glycosyltransferase RgtA/B/C/D-like domain-containing protein n=1 Tax=hydrothermal vent metagenome TaxID=652676 RepID=A0A3B0VHV7_9ZZZZ